MCLACAWRGMFSAAHCCPLACWCCGVDQVPPRQPLVHRGATPVRCRVHRDHHHEHHSRQQRAPLPPRLSCVCVRRQRRRRLLLAVVPPICRSGVCMSPLRGGRPPRVSARHACRGCSACGSSACRSSAVAFGVACEESTRGGRDAHRQSQAKVARPGALTASNPEETLALAG